MGTDIVVDGSRLDLAGPSHDAGNSVGAFPVGVLLAAEGGGGGIGPGVEVGAVVGGVHHDRVVGDALVVEPVEQASDAVVDRREVEYQPLQLACISSLVDIPHRQQPVRKFVERFVPLVLECAGEEEHDPVRLGERLFGEEELLLD